MALYTGKGDQGTSKLFDTPQGARISKGDPVFEALGTLDELNSTIGWARIGVPGNCMVAGKPLSAILHNAQNALFTIQAEVAGAQKTIPADIVEQVEAVIHAIDEEIPPIKAFIVPGGSELSSRLDIARTLARRTERRVVTVADEKARSVGEHSLRFLNRLSSLLYALARVVNYRHGVNETPPHYL